MNYIPINVKTHYELLSSLIKIDVLIKFIKEQNIPSVGITDSNMFGSIEFMTLAKKENIKPIIGIEIKINDLNYLIYAKNYNGYVNLLNLVSIRNTSNLTIETIKEHKEDLICVTKDYKNYLKYKEIYESVYLSYETKEERRESLTITDKIVYIKETLYIEESDKEYLIYLNMIRDGKLIDDINDYNYNNHMNKEIDEIDAKTTFDFVKQINLELKESHFKLPEYSKNKIELLTYLCNKGLNKRLNGKVTPEYKKRLEEELKVIIDMGFCDYFLIVYDFILYAKKHDIMIGPGRGSAAGSLVSYAVGITQIDPIKYNLIFERFLNKDRITMPDIDIDIEHLKRDELVEYVKNKYGKDKVSNIITFSPLLPKQVIRDVGRVLKIPQEKIDALAKTIKDKETFMDLKRNEYFIKMIKNDYEYQKLIRISTHLEGLKRHTSIHAAGIIISSEPLMNKVPLYKSANNILTGYTMEYLELIGLLKMDFLALKNLTTIKMIINKIKEEKNIYIDINKIPLNDQKTLKIFYDVDTTGIFQFESEGMMSFLRSLKVETFNDIITAIALYRPGPRSMISEFISVREKKKKPHYIIPELESILKDTNGIIIYQEQIIEILKRIGGFSYSKADIIRRAMSKKKEDVIIKYRSEFLNGAVLNGCNIKDAALIYDLVLKFANYGFNKSHSVAYALVAYQMAFLKAHFTEYYMMNELDMVIGNEIKTKEYIDEARTFNLIIKGVDINYSKDKYELINNTIYPPLTIIKSVGKEAVNHITEERQKGGPYKNYFDFLSRVYNAKTNTKVIESLILSGALDSLKLNRNTMLKNLTEGLNYAILCESLDKSLVEIPEIIIYPELSENELLKKEYELFGFYLKNHPVTKYKRTNTCLLKDIKLYFDKVINTLVMIDVIKEVTTKNNEKMAFITASDEYSKISVVAFPNTYKTSFGIKKGDIIKVTGKVERRINDYQIIANKIEKV